MKANGYTTLTYERKALRVLDDVINAEDAGVCVTDLETGQILLINDKMAAYRGEPDLVGLMDKSCPIHKSAERSSSCPLCARASLLDADGNPTRPHVREEYIEGMDIWLKIVHQAVRWVDERMIRIVTFSDITESRRMREQLAELKYKDRLLGIKNGVCLEKDMREAPAKPSLIFFEVMSMQKINELYGWEKGNYLLCAIRDAILSQKVPDSELYRVGGDRFCLAVDGISRSELRKLACNMAELFPGIWRIEYEGKTVPSFHEVAIAIIPSAYVQQEESLLAMSERTLTKAKEKRKIVVYSKKIDEVHKNRLRLEWDLKRCVHENMRGFNLFYQPIVSATTKEWCGLEALCRWDSPELGPIPPLVFIPEAERVELIGPIGLWVLETAVSRCKAWGLDRCDSFLLDVNVSAAQLQDESIAEGILDILERYRFPGSKLCIELTESTGVTFLDRSLRVIERLRERKVLVALDDFGTGYSSFSRLKNMPVDIVKIEKMFVSDIESDAYHRYLFQAMADLAHTADIKLIAEGVERKRQMNILVKDGADYMQGYLFSKPLSQADLEDKLTRFYS